MRAVERIAGFTLIEVIVALVVIGLGMLGVIQAVSQTAGNSGYLRDKTIAHWVAMNRLTEIRLQKSAPGIDKTSDEVEMAGRKWKWTMNVTQTQVETLRRIDISVRPAEASENSSTAFVTGFFGTAVAPPGTTLISWQGVTEGGPQQPGDKDGGKKGDQDAEQPTDTPTEPPPEPEDPGIEDPSLPQDPQG
jgi:general secretion pathway protein I